MDSSMDKCNNTIDYRVTSTTRVFLTKLLTLTESTGNCHCKELESSTVRVGYRTQKEENLDRYNAISTDDCCIHNFFLLLPHRRISYE